MIREFVPIIYIAFVCMGVFACTELVNRQEGRRSDPICDPVELEEFRSLCFIHSNTRHCDKRFEILHQCRIER